MLWEGQTVGPQLNLLLGCHFLGWHSPLWNSRYRERHAKTKSHSQFVGQILYRQVGQAARQELPYGVEQGLSCRTVW